MAQSSAVSSGELATAAQYNNLRDDVLSTSTGHLHDGTNGRNDGAFNLNVAGLPLTLENTTDGVSNQVLLLRGDNATRAANDEIYLTASLDDDAGASTEYVRLTFKATDVSAASDDGQFEIDMMTAGTLTAKYQFSNAALSPATTDDLSLGTTSLNWSDLFLDSGAVINFDSGDVTLTHAANTLTFAGGTMAFGANSVTGSAFNLTTPELGTPSAVVLTNATGLPTAGLVNSAVTYAKIQDVSATLRLLGRTTAGAGVVEEITIGVANGNIPRMDATGYPAADGSQITGLSAGLSQSTPTALKAETNEDTYAPPDLIKHSPGVAKVWLRWEQSGVHSITASYNMTSVTDGGAAGDTDHLWGVDFSGIGVYTIVGGAENNGTLGTTASSYAAGGVTTITRDAGSGTPVDLLDMTLAAFGDQ